MHTRDTATGVKPQQFSFPARCCVRDTVRVSALRPMLAGIAVAGLAASCGRTQLDLAQAPLATDAAVDRPADRPLDAAPDLPLDHPLERPDVGPDLAVEHPPDHPCVPTTEICNGVDDDCDGLVDEDQPPIPCENGGYRYCVAGSYSQCPTRCEVCVPGSTRTCFTSFCTFWGSQPCAPDGRSFGPCKEAMVPPECKPIVDKGMRTAELEQCCLNYGYCCLDEFDLNNNGDRTEMLGQCEAVACTP